MSSKFEINNKTLSALLDAEDTPEAAIQILSLSTSEIRSYLTRTDISEEDRGHAEILLRTAEMRTPSTLSHSDAASSSTKPTRTSQTFPPNELSPETLAHAINGTAAGAKAAFEKLYLHYELRVRRAVVTAGLRLGYLDDQERHERTEDLVQEVWMRLLDNDRRLLRSYDANRGAFGGFISVVAYQQALYCLHRRRLRPPDLDPGPMIETENFDYALKLMQSDLFTKLIAVAERMLDETDLKLLQEHYLEGKTVRSLAPMYGLNERTLQRRATQLKEKLRGLAKEQDSSNHTMEALLQMKIGGL